MKEKEKKFKLESKKLKELLKMVSNLLKEIEINVTNAKGFSITVEINTKENKPKANNKKKK